MPVVSSLIIQWLSTLCTLHARASDRADLTEETLLKQYQIVARRTSNNYTYNMGSHVLQFGALAIDTEPVADYLGELNDGARCIFRMDYRKPD